MPDSSIFSGRGVGRVILILEVFRSRRCIAAWPTLFTRLFCDNFHNLEGVGFSPGCVYLSHMIHCGAHQPLAERFLDLAPLRAR